MTQGSERHRSGALQIWAANRTAYMGQASSQDSSETKSVVTTMAPAAAALLPLSPTLQALPRQPSPHRQPSRHRQPAPPPPTAQLRPPVAYRIVHAGGLRVRSNPYVPAKSDAPTADCGDVLQLCRSQRCPHPMAACCGCTMPRAGSSRRTRASRCWSSSTTTPMLPSLLHSLVHPKLSLPLMMAVDGECTHNC